MRRARNLMRELFPEQFVTGALVLGITGRVFAAVAKWSLSP